MARRKGPRAQRLLSMIAPRGRGPCAPQRSTVDRVYNMLLSKLRVPLEGDVSNK